MGGIGERRMKAETERLLLIQSDRSLRRMGFRSERKKHGDCDAT